MMNRKGFTLIELVMVLVLIGIIVVMVIPKPGDLTATNAGAFSSKLQADMRYAQNLAMTRNQRARVTFRTSPNGYDVTLGGNPASDPATGSPFSITLNTGRYAGISISAIGFSGSYVEFNTLGVPFDSGGILTVSKSVTVSGGSVNRDITVQPQTGAVN